MFFEGSEKKVEVVVAGGAPSLRALGREFWADIVAQCNAAILSSISNDHCDAYLLSESSLFVWEDRFLMLTCGVTTLVNSVNTFIDRYGQHHLASVIFQRKNEYQSHLQKSSFADDLNVLQARLDGVAFQFGDLDGHHNYVYHLKQDYQPRPDDVTCELLMYHIQGEAAEYLRSEGQSAARIRSLFRFDELLPGFELDDYVFEPFGYSLNAIRGEHYVTVHVTPQEDSSYVSFETNLDLNCECPHLLSEIIAILSPQTFDIISFNLQPELTIAPAYLLRDRVEQPLSCGYRMRFFHYLRPYNESRSAFVLL